MRNGKYFRTFIETLREGDMIKIYGCDTVQIHHPRCTYRDPENNASACGTCLDIWSARCHGGQDCIARCMQIMDDVVDGALQMRGLTLSRPVIVDKQENPLPLLTSQEYYPSDVEAESELDKFGDSGWIEYRVLKLE